MRQLRYPAVMAEGTTRSLRSESERSAITIRPVWSTDTDTTLQSSESSELPLTRQYETRSVDNLAEVIPSISDSDAYDTDLETDEKKPARRSMDCQAVYMDQCRKLGIVPASCILKHIDDEKLKLRHRGIGPRGAEALALTLVINTTLVSLNLEDNGIGDDGAVHIADMLSENCYITNLNLTGNQIGHLGCMHLCEMLTKANTLLKLNLSGNGLRDEDTKYIAALVAANKSMRKLNVSRNNIGEKSGDVLGNALAQNDHLVCLDLSWNNFRGMSAVKLLRGIKVNTWLTDLNLAWNGLADFSCKYISACLSRNGFLQYLDISANRITEDGASILARCLMGKTTLVTFRIGRNPIKSTGALELLTAIDTGIRKGRCSINCLDLTGIDVDEAFIDLHKKILSTRDMIIRHASIEGDFSARRKLPATPSAITSDVVAIFQEHLDAYMRSEPMGVIVQYLEDHGDMTLNDLIDSLVSEEADEVSEESLLGEIKKLDIPLAEGEVRKMILKLNNGLEGSSAKVSALEMEYDRVTGERQLMRDRFSVSGIGRQPQRVHSPRLVQ